MATTETIAPATENISAIKFGIVTRDALLRRLNRKLLAHGGMIHTHRTEGSSGGIFWDRGDCYLMDELRNRMVNVRIDLETFAREWGCLSEHEALVAI